MEPLKASIGTTTDQTTDASIDKKTNSTEYQRKQERSKRELNGMAISTLDSSLGLASLALDDGSLSLQRRSCQSSAPSPVENE